MPVSLTGQFRTQGHQALAGLQSWVRWVEDSGGLLLGRQRFSLKLRYYDDASRVETAAAAARRLIREDRVDLLFGPYSSGLSANVAEVAAEYGQLLWNQGGAADTIYRSDRRVVGILTGAPEYLAPLPALLRAAEPAASSFAVLCCSPGAFPRQVSAGLENRALALGFTEVLRRDFPPEQSDFTRLAAEVTEAAPELLLAVGRIRHDIAIARALASRWRDLSPDQRRPRVAAVVAAPLERFRLELGKAAENFVGPAQWEPSNRESAAGLPQPWFGPTPAQALATLRRAGASAGGLAVDYPMAQAYAAGLVAQKCLQESGTPEPARLWEVAGNQDFHTFFGRFRIDPATGRQTGRSVNIIQWQRGRKVVIWPPEQSQGNLILT